jgi:hypothetical protein
VIIKYKKTLSRFRIQILIPNASLEEIRGIRSKITQLYKKYFEDIMKITNKNTAKLWLTSSFKEI